MYVVVAAAVVPDGYPRIIENPSLKSVEKDRNTVMICNSAGDPEPSIVWYKDYVPVDMSDPRLKLLPTGNFDLFKYSMVMMMMMMMVMMMVMMMTMLEIKIDRPKLVSMCGYRLATNWQNFSEIYLA